MARHVLSNRTQVDRRMLSVQMYKYSLSTQEPDAGESQVQGQEATWKVAE